MQNRDNAQKSGETTAAEDLSAFPPAFQMARNLVKQAWASGAGVAKGRAFLAKPEVANRRLEICAGCEFFRDRRCLKCGCFMDRKAHLEAASCPAGKWPAASSRKSGDDSCHYGDRPFSVEAFPENERAELMRLAAASVVTGGNFTFKGEALRARMKPGSEAIEVIKPSPARTAVEFWSESEKAEMQSLVTDARRAGRMSVSFKGRTFSLERGMNRRGGPTTAVEYFTQSFSEVDRAAFAAMANATKAAGGHEFEFKGRKYQFGVSAAQNSNG